MLNSCWLNFQISMKFPISSHSNCWIPYNVSFLVVFDLCICYWLSPNLVRTVICRYFLLCDSPTWTNLQIFLFINFHWSCFFVVRISFIIGTHTLELFIQGESMQKCPKNSPKKFFFWVISKFRKYMMPCEIILFKYVRASNVICWSFWKFQKLYQPFKNLLSIYFANFSSCSHCEKIN